MSLTTTITLPAQTPEPLLQGRILVPSKLKTQLPVELLRDIIAELLVDAFDALTKMKSLETPETVVWEKDVIRRLAHISYYFREVTKEVATKLFVIDPKDRCEGLITSHIP